MNPQIRLAAAAGVCTLAMALGACGDDDNDTARQDGDTSSAPPAAEGGTDPTGAALQYCHEDPPDGTPGGEWHLRCLAGDWEYSAAKDAVGATMTIQHDGNTLFVPEGGEYVYEGTLDPEGMTLELLPVEGEQVVEGESQFFELTWLDDEYETLIVEGGGDPMEFTRVA